MTQITTQNCCPFLYRSNATKSEVTRFFKNVPLDVSDVFLMTFMILLDSYMEPTRVGSDIGCISPYEYIMQVHVNTMQQMTFLT